MAEALAPMAGAMADATPRPLAMARAMASLYPTPWSSSSRRSASVGRHRRR
ncbi:hypothetical protein BKA01_002081 [Pseudonocardia eucalypti]|nr:hypothetical protein [Pseudonocardia eucalypti]